MTDPKTREGFPYSREHPMSWDELVRAFRLSVVAVAGVYLLLILVYLAVLFPMTGFAGHPDLSWVEYWFVFAVLSVGWAAPAWLLVSRHLLEQYAQEPETMSRLLPVSGFLLVAAPVALLSMNVVVRSMVGRGSIAGPGESWLVYLLTSVADLAFLVVLAPLLLGGISYLFLLEEDAEGSDDASN